MSKYFSYNPHEITAANYSFKKNVERIWRTSKLIKNTGSGIKKVEV
jgi:hypothetical protein